VSDPNKAHDGGHTDDGHADGSHTADGHADDGHADNCTTTNSFSDHSIVDGADLITETYYRLQAPDRQEFTPSEAFFDRLESAFIWAYLGSVDEPGIPTHVELAIDDARARTREAFEDQPTADLRTDVVPAFYRRVAGFHCRYRD
jgi:hypothetical protein